MDKRILIGMGMVALVGAAAMVAVALTTETEAEKTAKHMLQRAWAGWQARVGGEDQDG